MVGTRPGRAAGSLMAVVGLALALSGCAASAASAGPAAATGTATPATRTPQAGLSATPAEAHAELIALGVDDRGTHGLWSCDRQGCRSIRVDRTATAVARFGDAVALAGPGGVEGLSVAWPSGGPSASDPVVAMARAPSGVVALVTRGESSTRYWLVGSSGAPVELSPSPAQPFAPAVAWLDDDRLLALSTDANQESRLVEIVPGEKTPARVAPVLGVRDMALSADRGTVALVTGTSVMVGEPDALFETSRPAVMADVPDGSVAWAVAVSDTGDRVAFAQAVMGADGTARSARARVYARDQTGWHPVAEFAVSLASVVDLVWAPGA